MLLSFPTSFFLVNPINVTALNKNSLPTYYTDYDVSVKSMIPLAIIGVVCVFWCENSKATYLLTERDGSELLLERKLIIHDFTCICLCPLLFPAWCRRNSVVKPVTHEPTLTTDTDRRYCRPTLLASYLTRPLRRPERTQNEREYVLIVISLFVCVCHCEIFDVIISDEKRRQTVWKMSELRTRSFRVSRIVRTYFIRCFMTAIGPPCQPWELDRGSRALWCL